MQHTLGDTVAQAHGSGQLHKLLRASLALLTAELACLFGVCLRILARLPKQLSGIGCVVIRITISCLCSPGRRLCPLLLRLRWLLSLLASVARWLRVGWLRTLCIRCPALWLPRLAVLAAAPLALLLVLLLPLLLMRWLLLLLLLLLRPAGLPGLLCLFGGLLGPLLLARWHTWRRCWRLLRLRLLLAPLGRLLLLLLLLVPGRSSSLLPLPMLRLRLIRGLLPPLLRAPACLSILRRLARCFSSLLRRLLLLLFLLLPARLCCYWRWSSRLCSWLVVAGYLCLSRTWRCCRCCCRCYSCGGSELLARPFCDALIVQNLQTRQQHCHLLPVVWQRC
jgi:hypothetical protein